MSMALVYRVEPGYLTAMGVPLKRGRFFTDQDDERTPNVVVIDEVFARKHFGDADPVGKRIMQDGQDPQQIIGVVGHVKQWSIDSDEEQTLQAQLYEPFRQFSDNSMNGLAAGFGVVTRFDGPSPPFEAIRRVVQSQNKQNVISRTTNDERSDRRHARRPAVLDDSASGVCRSGVVAREPRALRRHLLSGGPANA